MKSAALSRSLGIETPPQRIPSLDGLRAVSIALVILSHASHEIQESIFRWVGDVGLLGVRVFFVISGFLITSLLLDEYRRTGSVSLRWFYFRRTMRIFPAFYTFIAVLGCIAVLWKLEIPASDFLFGATYTMNYVADPSWALGHLWSLAVEEQFYLLWPATLALLGINGGFKAAAAVIAIAPLVRFACLYIPAARPLIGLSFPTIADPLAAGCLLAAARTWLSGRMRYLAFLRSPASALLVPGIFILNGLPGTKLNMLVTQTLLNGGIALMIDRWVRFPGGRFGRLLNREPARSIGVLSYSLYLWQQPFFNPRGFSVLNSFPLNLGCTLFCAYLSYRLVEKPCLNLRSRLELRWRKQRCFVVGAKIENR